jgi:hypothetical protein
MPCEAVQCTLYFKGVAVTLSKYVQMCGRRKEETGQKQAYCSQASAAEPPSRCTSVNQKLPIYYKA